MVFFTSLIPITMFLIELLWNKHPPKKINSIYGYRTIRSMKNRETWEFAHKLCAKIRTICGISLEVFSILVIMLFSAYWDGCRNPPDNPAFRLIGLFLFPVESALKRNFTENGQRKKQASPIGERPVFYQNSNDE